MELGGPYTLATFSIVIKELYRSGIIIIFFPDIYKASGLAKNFIQHQMQSRKFTNIDTKKRRYIQYSHTQNNKQYYSTIKIQLQKLNMF